MFYNIAFARGGAHLPLAHALRLLSTQELRFWLTKLKLRKKEVKNWLGEFFWEGGKFFRIFLSIFFGFRQK